MLKNFLLYSLLLIYPNVFGQNLILYDLNDNDISADTIVVEGFSSENLIELGLKIKNNSQAAIDVKVKKEEISVQSGTENYFCWKDCYQPNVFVSPDYLTIDAGTVNDRSFKGDFKPNQISGENFIRYTFFNVNDTKDTVTVLVNFKITIATAINKITHKKVSSSVYPNPAKEYVTVKYKFNDACNLKFKTYNMSGKLIEEQNINKQEGSIILRQGKYGKGVYLYHFIQNEQIIESGKIVFQ